MGKGLEYESLIKQVYELIVGQSSNTSILTNQKIPSPDGDRQIDIILRTRVADIEIVTAIECKDHSRITDIQKIDAFRSVMESCKINKGIMISRKGFTRNAAKAARRFGISLYQIDRMGGFQKNLQENSPAMFVVLTLTNLGMSFSCYKSDNTMFLDTTSFIWGRPLVEIMTDCMKHQAFDPGARTLDIAKLPYYEAPWIKDSLNNRIQITNLKLDLKFSQAFKYGYFKDLPDFVVRENLETGQKDYLLIDSIDEFEADLFIPIEGEGVYIAVPENTPTLYAVKLKTDIKISVF